MKKQYGFGIIGTGSVGNLHAKAISEIEEAKLEAVFDIDKERAWSFASVHGCAGYDDFDSFLMHPGIDIVTICTPSGLHGGIAVKAAQAKKHVVIEKPIEISLEKADAIINCCRDNNVKCSVVSQHRFDDDVVRVRKLLDEGKLGKLYFGECKTKWFRNDKYYESTWRGTREIDGGGALINQSIHYIDLLLYLIGDWVEVYGQCGTLGHAIEVEDIGTALVKFKSGALGMVEGTTIAYPGLYTELVIYGEKGSLCIKNDRLEFCNIHGENDIKPGADKNRQTTGAAVPDAIQFISHKRQFEDVIKAVEDDIEPMVTGADGRKTLEFILAVYESSKRKVTVLKKGD